MYVVLKSKLNGRYLTKIVDCNSRYVFQAKDLKYSTFNGIFQIYRTTNDQISFALMNPTTNKYGVNYDLMLAINSSSSLVTAMTKTYLYSHSSIQQIAQFNLVKNSDLTFSIMSNENKKFIGSIDINRFPLEALFSNKGDRAHFFIEVVNNYNANEKGLFYFSIKLRFFTNAT